MFGLAGVGTEELEEAEDDQSPKLALITMLLDLSRNNPRGPAGGGLPGPMLALAKELGGLRLAECRCASRQ